MHRDLARLAARPFDLLVIGGGIHGLATAYDAAQRGLDVALVESGDLGGGTSSNHLKTIHGGLRYLQSADLKRVRESIIERRILARIAPHLLTPLAFLMPTYRKPTRCRLAMRVAFLMDAAIGHDRNAGVTPRLHLPTGRTLPRDECLALFPDVRTAGLTGGAMWSDLQVCHTDRLALAYAIGADAAGACLANYAEAVAPLTEGTRVTGAHVRDGLTGSEFDVRARVTVNAAGPAAGLLMAAFGVPRPLPLLKAMNLVTRRPMSGPALASSTNDGRMLFVVPWQGRLVAGTSHSLRTCTATDTAVTDAELTSFIEEVNEAFPALRLMPQDVTRVHRGVVPARQDRRGVLGLEGHTRIRHHARDGAENLVSLIGVKFTTARGVAEAAVDAVLRVLGRTAPCRTAETPLPGGDVPDLDLAVAMARADAPATVSEAALRQMAAIYGTGCRSVLGAARSTSAWRLPIADEVPIIRAQVVHAVRNEMACTLVDVVARRLPLGAAGHPGRAAAEGCAAIMAEELAWSQARVQREMRALDEFYLPVTPPRQ